MNNQNWTLSPAYLKLFIQLAREERFPLAAVLRDTGIDRESVMRDDRPIPFEALLQMLDNVTRLARPGWHLDLADRLNVPAHGALGFAVVTAPDMREALNVLLRYIGIRGPFLWLAAEEEGEQYIIRFYEALPMGASRQLLLELAALSVQGLVERPLGKPLADAEMAFACPPPPYRDRLAAVFHGRLKWNARRHSLRFPTTWLDEPCALHDAAMHRYLVARCEDEMRELACGLPTEVAVRQALLATPGEWPGLADLAGRLNVSGRTLIRRLHRGNTSYREIRDQVRKTLAVDYLQNSDIPVGRIAYRLGFNDPSNFGRAFRGWFGVSPGVFRQRGIRR